MTVKVKRLIVIGIIVVVAFVLGRLTVRGILNLPGLRITVLSGMKA